MIYGSKLKLFIAYLLLIVNVDVLYGQTDTDTTAKQQTLVSSDDPSQFFTRTEFFSELQTFKNGKSDFYLNQTTFRNIVKIGKRFTTRLDIPFVYNSLSLPSGEKQFGLGDISIRLLGYKFMESPKRAITASIELSFNTANSRLTGTGKNIILPVVTYTSMAKNKRQLIAFVFQEAISFSGEESRQDISFSKLQIIMVRYWSRKSWTIVAPETYLDHIGGGLSMNLEARMVFAPTQRINLWIQAGAGIFGDFAARYQWGSEVGCRYHFMRNTMIKRKNN